MNKPLTTILFVTSLGVSSQSYAAPIDFIDNTNYTTDTISGLDWLDMSYSAGLSYDEIPSISSTVVGGGWRLATGSEFATMVLNYTGTGISQLDFASTEFTNGYLEPLIDLFGCTNCASYAGSPQFSAGILADEYFAGGYWFAMLYDSGNSYYYADSATMHYAGMPADQKQSDIGAFLVRENVTYPPSTVPIPAAAFLFAPALFGLVGLRRKVVNV